MQKQHTIHIASYDMIEDNGAYIVQLRATGEYFELSAAAADGLRLLAEGAEPDAAARRLSAEYPDERIEIDEFLADLRAMGFVREPGEPEPVHGGSYAPQAAAGVWRSAFHPRVAPLYGLVAAANIALFATVPSLFPVYADLLPFSSMLANTASLLAVSLLLLMLHECGHVLAARSCGIRARVRFGHRLFIVVLETEMADIWRVSRARRNMAYLAGLCVDHCLLLGALLTLACVPELPPAVSGLLGIAVFQWVAMTVFQFMIFMKTDLYYVLTNVTGAHHLMDDAAQWWRGRLRLGGRSAARTGMNGDARQANDGARRLVRVYALVHSAGLLGAAALLACYIAPQLAVVLHTSVARLFGSASPAYKLDGALTLLQLLVMAGLLVFSLRRTYKPPNKDETVGRPFS